MSSVSMLYEPASQSVAFLVVREGDHIHKTFSIVHCYNCSILLVITIINFLLCLIYKLNLITGMYI